MKLLFERETELVRCDGDKINGHFGEDPGDWMALAHTTAAMTNSHGMLRIEQRCYLRSTERPDDVRTQGWVRPEMTFEAILGSEDETMQMVEELHARFVQRAREELAAQSLAAIPKVICSA